MPIAIIVLVLVAYGYVMIAYPEYRTWGLAAGGAVAAALGLYFWLSEPEATRAGDRIAPYEVQLDQLAVERSLRGAVLTGRVRNLSPEHRLRELTIALTLHDCPEPGAELADCPIIGGSTAIARPDAPPGQLRTFRANYIFAGLPEPEGEARWQWRIVEIRAAQ